MSIRYAVVTNPAGEEKKTMKEQSQQAEGTGPDFKKGAGTLALTLIGLGVSLGVRAALGEGTTRNWWSPTAAAGVQTAVGAGVALFGAAYDSPRFGAAVGGANVAVGGDALIQNLRLAYAQAPATTQPGTTRPGTPAPTTRSGGGLPGGARAPAAGYGGQRHHAQYRG